MHPSGGRCIPIQYYRVYKVYCYASYWVGCIVIGLLDCPFITFSLHGSCRLFFCILITLSWKVHNITVFQSCLKLFEYGLVAEHLLCVLPAVEWKFLTISWWLTFHSDSTMCRTWSSLEYDMVQEAFTLRTGKGFSYLCWLQIGFAVHLIHVWVVPNGRCSPALFCLMVTQSKEDFHIIVGITRACSKRRYSFGTGSATISGRPDFFEF